jgi:hypothetical protein|tara:strand:- start:456 stop:704 length:249 start_codon:yes stop_codon:yes gene_type:complete
MHNLGKEDYAALAECAHIPRLPSTPDSGLAESFELLFSCQNSKPMGVFRQNLKEKSKGARASGHYAPTFKWSSLLKNKIFNG